MARSNIVRLIADSLYTRNLTTNYQYSQRLPMLLTANQVCHTKITKNAPPSSLIPTTTVANQATRAFSNQSDNQEAAGVENAPPPAGTPPPPSWRKWTAGIMVTVIIPFLHFKEQVDTVVEKTEQLIDVVEVVAEAVDVAAENVNKELEEGNNLKTAVEFVEDVAEKVAKNAQKAGDFIDEVQEVEQKLGGILEPVKHRTKEAA